MGTVAEKLEKVLDTKARIKAACIVKGQSITDTTPFDEYPDKVLAIQTGVDTSDATATAGNILSGKTAYVNGVKVTGTITTKTASNLKASGATVTVPAGYYASQATKTVETNLVSYPSINVSTNGLITASVVQGEGYVQMGTRYSTEQLDTQAAQTITPGTTDKTAVAAGRYTTGEVKVEGDVNLLAENIKSGVSIFGVTGSLEAEGSTPILGALAVTADSGSIRIPLNGISDSVIDSITNILITPYAAGSGFAEILSSSTVSLPSGTGKLYYPICVRINKPTDSNIYTANATYLRVTSTRDFAVVTCTRPHNTTMFPAVSFKREVTDGVDGFTVIFRGNTGSAQVKIAGTSWLAVLTNEIDTTSVV